MTMQLSKCFLKSYHIYLAYLNKSTSAASLYKSFSLLTVDSFCCAKMEKGSVLLRTTVLGLTALVVCGQPIFPPPSAFYPFPTWMSYPFYNSQYRPPNNFTHNATAFNGTYWRDPKYYYPSNYSYNHTVQYGGNLFVGYIWPIDRLLFNQVRKFPSDNINFQLSNRYENGYVSGLPGLMNSLLITWAASKRYIFLCCCHERNGAII